MWMAPLAHSSPAGFHYLLVSTVRQGRGVDDGELPVVTFQSKIKPSGFFYSAAQRCLRGKRSAKQSNVYRNKLINCVGPKGVCTGREQRQANLFKLKVWKLEDTLISLF